MANKKRIATSVAAVATAAALLLGGTFAWQSVNQTALNEGADTVNPGGRLHNDMWYVSAEENNNDIYVENFAEEDIFARVRLSEYMEIVLNQGTPGEKAVTVAGSKTDKDPAGETDTTGRNLYDYTYATHYFHDVDNDPTTPSNATEEYWEWTMGNADSVLPYYMPTFNKNKDSVAPDLNGLYRDRVGGISDRSWKQYTELDGATDLPENYSGYASDSSKNGKAIYDADSNMDDELKALDAVALENIINRTTTDITAYEKAIKLQEETHEAKPVGETKGLISLTAWLAMVNTDGVYNEDKHGGYWVYDDTADGEDVDTAPDGAGWVYWSSPIKGGEATGLLLDGIKLKNVMDDTWYYAIEAVGQFVTANDLGSAENGDGFYANGETITDGAFELLGKVIGFEEKLTINGPTGLVMGQTAQYSVSMTRGGVPVEAPAVTWSIEPTVAAAAEDGEEDTVAGVTISETGLVTVADNAQAGLSFDVVAATVSVSVKQTVTVGYPTLTLYTTSNTQTLLEKRVSQSYKVIFTDSTVAADQFAMTSITELNGGSLHSYSAENTSYDPVTQILTVYDYFADGLKATFTAEGTDQTYVAEFLPVETLEITVNSDGTASGKLSSWDSRYYALKFKDTEGNSIDAQVSNVALSGEYANGTTYEPFNGSVKNYLFVKDNEQHVAFTADFNGQQIDILAKYNTANTPVALPMADMTVNESGIYTGTISDSFANNGGSSYSGCAAAYTIETAKGECLTLRSKEETPLTEGSAIIDTNGSTYLSLENSDKKRTVSLEGFDQAGNVYAFEFSVVEAPVINAVTSFTSFDEQGTMFMGAEISQASVDTSRNNATVYQYEEEEVKFKFTYDFDVTLGFSKDDHEQWWRAAYGNGNGPELVNYTIAMDRENAVLSVGPYLDMSLSASYNSYIDSIDVESVITVGGESVYSEESKVATHNLWPVERGRTYDISDFYYGRAVDVTNYKPNVYHNMSKNTVFRKEGDAYNGKFTVGYDEKASRIELSAYNIPDYFYYEQAYLVVMDPVVDGGETVMLTAPADAIWATTSDKLSLTQTDGVVTFTVPDGTTEETYPMTVTLDGETTSMTVTRRADPIVITYTDKNVTEETELVPGTVNEDKYVYVDLEAASTTDDDPSTQNIFFNAYRTNYGEYAVGEEGLTPIEGVTWSIRDRNGRLEYVDGKGIVKTQYAIDTGYSTDYTRVYVVATLSDGTSVQCGIVIIRTN